MERGIPEGHKLRFEYFEFPGIIYRLKSRFDPLTWPYYFLWQLAIVGVASRLHGSRPFALAHHVTFVSFRVPVWLKRLGVPVVFGPVGGADTAPFHLLGRGFGPRVWCKEVLRNALTGAGAVVMRLLPPLMQGRGVCLAATPAMGRIFEWSGFPHEVFPAVGMDPGQAREPRAHRSAPRFLFVGRFHPLKGTHLLVEAFARARIEGSRLTLIGSGQDECKLRKLATRLGIDAQLTWTGKLPRTELAARYREHDVLVAPSLYESGGLAVLEAMAEGLPAIVLDVGGHSVSVAEGCGVKISPDGSVDEVIERLAEAMRGYAQSPSKIADDGRRARDRIANAYEWTHKARRMKAIYERLLASALSDS